MWQWWWFSQLGHQHVRVANGRASLADAENTLAGSVLTMDAAVRNMVTGANCSVALALEAASTTPAKVLQIYPRKGSLSYGADADLVLFREHDLSVAATVVGGHLVFADSAPLSMLQSPTPTVLCAGAV